MRHYRCNGIKAHCLDSLFFVISCITHDGVSIEAYFCTLFSVQRVDKKKKKKKQLRRTILAESVQLMSANDVRRNTCVLAIYFSPIYEKDRISRNNRSYCKYFYRTAKLAVIHVNDLAYLLTRHSKTSFTFSYFFNYFAFFFFSRAFNCYTISVPRSVKFVSGERNTI